MAIRRIKLFPISYRYRMTKWRTNGVKPIIQPRKARKIKEMYI